MCIIQGLKNTTQILGIFQWHEMNPVYTTVIDIAHYQQVLQLPPDPCHWSDVGL